MTAKEFEEQASEICSSVFPSKHHQTHMAADKVLRRKCNFDVYNILLTNRLAYAYYMGACQPTRPEVLRKTVQSRIVEPLALS